MVLAELCVWPFPGLFSSLMREQANITHDGPKWIVLDGDIDPMWIESLNTVMDDNKVDKIKISKLIL